MKSGVLTVALVSGIASFSVAASQASSPVVEASLGYTQDVSTVPEIVVTAKRVVPPLDAARRGLDVAIRGDLLVSLSGRLQTLQRVPAQQLASL